MSQKKEKQKTKNKTLLRDKLKTFLNVKVNKNHPKRNSNNLYKPYIYLNAKLPSCL